MKNRSENLAGRRQISSVLPGNSCSIAQKSGEIWTGQANLQPISFKPDRLLATLAAELGAALKKHGFMLALAESCTGGLVAQTVTSIAGSSAWFERGFITYSNIAKTEMLGVSNDCLETHGAVSEQTAINMALGALANSHAQIAGSITGIAGPDGGTAEKPVGTVCFSWVSKGKPVVSSTQHFQGDRAQIRQQAAIFLMTRLVESLNQSDQRCPR